jgi:hypothetical protein
VKRLDYGIRPPDKSLEGPVVLLKLQIKGDAAFICIVGVPQEALVRLVCTPGKRGQPARRVAARRLNFYDIGAEVPEKLPAVEAALVTQVENSVRL